MSYAVAAIGQEATIFGVVRDVNTHREIREVNIYVKGSQLGTSSDISGRFFLRVPGANQQMIVVFQHIAYEPREISLDSVAAMRHIDLQPRIIPLQEVEVEAQGVPILNIEKDLPQTVSLIEARNFEFRGYVDAGDLLKTDHSVQVEEALSGRKTVAIRGGNPDEVVVLYNGVKMNNTFDNIFDLSLVDLEDVERFEIIKGSNTALYGPEAFSGVINIIPKIQQDYNIRFQQRLGTYRSGNWGLHLYQRLNRLSGSYSFKRGGATRNLGNQAEEEGRLENTALYHTANLTYNSSDEETNMRNFKFLTLTFAAGIWFLPLAGCTSNPFGGDEITGGNRQISGNHILKDKSSPERIYVWLEGFGLNAWTNNRGEFQINLPPASQGPAGGVDGVFTLYFYLANYSLQSTTVITRKGEFVYSKGEIDKNGRLTAPKELEKFLEISTEVNPDSISTNFAGIVEVNVTLRASRDSATVIFPSSLNRPLGAIILRRIGSEGILVFQSVVGDFRRNKEIVGFVPVTRKMAFTLVSNALSAGEYEVIPHMLISHEYVPPDLIASLGGNVNEPGPNHLNIPFRRTNGRIEIR
ncbi:MAG: TonB-dependent receptor [bacterium]